MIINIITWEYMQNYTAAEAEVQLYSILMCDKKKYKMHYGEETGECNNIREKIFMLIMENL